MLSMGLVLLYSNGLHFLIAWEMFAISAFFLITLDRQRRGAGRGLAVSGGLARGHAVPVRLFRTLAARTGAGILGRCASTRAGAVVLARAGGLRREGGLLPLARLAALGARERAEPRLGHHVGRGDQDGHVRDRALQRMAARAGGGGLGGDRARARRALLLGMAFALAQNDLKRLLAYCSVENIGVILIGVGGALLAATHGDAPWGRLALAGALLHVWNHGALQVAAVLRRRLGAARHGHARDEPAGRAVARDAVDGRAYSPWRGGDLGAAAAQRIRQRMAGLSRTVRRGGGREPRRLGGHARGDRAGGGGRLALAGFVKAGAIVFLGAPRTQAGGAGARMRRGMRGPMLALAGVCVLDWAGARLILAGAGARGGRLAPGVGGTERPRSLAMLGSVQAALAFWFWPRLRGCGGRRRERPAPRRRRGTAATPRRPRGCSTPAAPSRGLPPAGSAGCCGRSALRRPRGPFPSAALRSGARSRDRPGARHRRRSARSIMQLSTACAACSTAAAVLHPLCAGRPVGLGCLSCSGGRNDFDPRTRPSAGGVAPAGAAAAGHHQQGEGLGGRPPGAAGAAALLRSRAPVAKGRRPEHAGVARVSSPGRRWPGWRCRARPC